LSLDSLPYHLFNHWHGSQDANTVIMGPYGPVSIIQCEQGAKPFGLHVYMTEVPADSAKGNHALVDETTGFYTVQPDESVIFVLDKDGEWKVMTLGNLG